MNPRSPMGPKKPPYIPELAEEVSTPVYAKLPDWAQLVKSAVSKPQFATRLPGTLSQILPMPLTAPDFEGNALTVTFPACARKLKHSTTPLHMMYFLTMNPLI